MVYRLISVAICRIRSLSCMLLPPLRMVVLPSLSRGVGRLRQSSAEISFSHFRRMRRSDFGAVNGQTVSFFLGIANILHALGIPDRLNYGVQSAFSTQRVWRYGNKRGRRPV